MSKTTNPWNFLPEIDIWGWMLANPWVPLLIVAVLTGAAWFGITKLWEKITFSYNAKGEPLPPLGFIIRRAVKLMYREDTYPVVTKGKLAGKLTGLTWQRFWLITTVAVLVSPGLFFLPAIIGGTLAVILLITIFAGIAHIKKVNRYRHHILMQMFEVAIDAMRYQRGAELNPWGYVQITEWNQVYFPGPTYVMYPAKFRSEDPRNRDMFERNFNGSVSDQHTWTYTWESSNNRVLCEPVPFISERADYNFPDSAPWYQFPLGLGAGGEEVHWDVSVYPHCLVAGTTGSGKSVTQATILLHALQSPDWRVLLVDPKRVELTVYRNHPHVLKVATELEDSLALIEQLEEEMQNRYKLMQDQQVNHFRSLKDVPPAILLMVDETFQLLSPTGIKNEEGKAQDEMKARIGILLSNIARLGRASGIHQILATQRPDAKVLPGELKANLDARIAQGRMDTIPSQMTLDSDAATHLPAVKGRAVYRAGQELSEFQAYYMDPKNLPMVVKMSATLAQGDRSFLDKVAGLTSQPEPTKGMRGKIGNWLSRREQRNQQKSSEREAKKEAKRAEKQQRREDKVEKKIRDLPPRPGRGTADTSTPPESADTSSAPLERAHYPEAHEPDKNVGPTPPLPDLSDILPVVPSDDINEINDWEDLNDAEVIEYWNPDGSEETLTPAEAQAEVFGLTITQVRERSQALGRDIELTELVEERVQQQRLSKNRKPKTEVSPPSANTPLPTVVDEETDDRHVPMMLPEAGTPLVETPSSTAAPGQEQVSSTPKPQRPTEPTTASTHPDDREEFDDDTDGDGFTAQLNAPWMPQTVRPVDTRNSPFSQDN